MFHYLGKTDIDKSFKKLQKDKLEYVEADYVKCCDIIKTIILDFSSTYKDSIKVYNGNLEDLTNDYKKRYISYLKDFKEKKKDRYSYYYPQGDPQTEEEYVKYHFKQDYHETHRFEKYTPNKKEEDKVFYFEFKKYFRSKLFYKFSIYFNSENILCCDRITLKKIDYLEYEMIEVQTATILPETMMGLFNEFLELDIAGKEIYKKRKIQLEADNIKKNKVKGLKKKAGLINIKKILDEMNCAYALEEMKNAIKVQIELSKGRTAIKIPKKNLNKALELLPEFVESILKADKLNIQFKHKQI